ncbi:Nicotinate phosphoribosyltransferase [Arachis hypogaea]|nr:Nicotinate phosphoribosyltransferase [Arachis hypogaea]
MNSYVIEDWIQLYQLDIYQAQSVRCDAKSLEDALIKCVMVTPEEVASSCNFVTPSLCGGGKRRDGAGRVRVGRKGETGNENVNSILHNRMVSPLFFKDPYSLDFGRFFTGYGIGVISYVVPIYIAEIAPKNLRGGLATINQLMIVIRASDSFLIGIVITWRQLALAGPFLLTLLGCHLQAQAMKEQAQLREKMAYQYKLGNFEAAAAIQRRLNGLNQGGPRQRAEALAALNSAFKSSSGTKSSSPKTTGRKVLLWKLALPVIRSGIPNFCAVALALNELGYKAVGIRLDSGDLAYLSCQARKIFCCIEKEFAVSGFGKTSITASNDLNEKTLDALNKQWIEQASEPNKEAVIKAVLLVGVPGAGGFDAVFAVTLGDSSSNVTKT